jgi:hypothetical protein
MKRADAFMKEAQNSTVDNQARRQLQAMSENAVFNDVQVDGTIGVQGGTELNDLEAAGAVSFGGTLAVFGQTTLQGVNADDVGISGGLDVTGSAVFDGNVLLLGAVPANASSTGISGTVARDANFIYVCTATNTWKRVAIATW